MKRNIILGAVCSLALSFNSAAAVVDTPFLNALSEEARTNSAALKASESRVEAAREERRAVRTWEDPMIEMGGVLAKKEMRMDEGDIVYGVEQPLPLFGRPKVAKNAADAEITVAESRHEMEFQLLRRDISIAAFKLALAEAEVELAKEEVEWLRLTQRVAEERYANGMGEQVEALRAQTETTRAANMISTATQEREVARATLNRLLNRPADQEWERLELPEVAPEVPYTPAAVRLALQGEPELRLLKAEAEAAAARTHVARKAAKPMVGVALEGRQYSGEGAFREGAVVFKMSVPWVNRDKYKADIRRAQALAEAAEHEARDYEAAVRAEVRMLVTRIDQGRREALLLRDEALPRARQTLTAAEAGWRAGADSLRDVIEARRMLLDIRRGYLRAVTEQYLAMSELVLCCGLGDFEALQTMQEAVLRKEAK
ncbi:MAG TPA: TolC family protein [Methylomirabilota bacterium]|nr:TolC family protein [Methylomirabilota bacterium]